MIHDDHAFSPPGGYVGGGLQLQVDIGVGRAGDVWVTNNWQDHASCYGKPNEGASTRCAGRGVVVFYGMAKPVADAADWASQTTVVKRKFFNILGRAVSALDRYC